MGSDVTTVQQDPQATPEEQEQNKLALERERAAQPGLLGVQQAGLGLSEALLRGQDLPGFLQSLPGGISPEAIGSQATQLASQNLAGFQNLGLGDSGVAFAETSKDIAQNLLFPAEQFNLQNLSQLLNLAIGGQAQVQAPIQAQSQALGQRLAGLRSMTQTTTAMNPFLKSFQESLGKTAGSPSFGPVGGFNFGGA